LASATARASCASSSPGAGRAAACAARRYVLRVVADQDREVDGQEQADLLGDRGEHRLRRFAPRYQRGHPPQRGLLLGKLTKPRLSGRITAHPPVGGTGIGT
jgi:hypothetical protein